MEMLEEGKELNSREICDKKDMNSVNSSKHILLDIAEWQKRIHMALWMAICLARPRSG